MFTNKNAFKPKVRRMALISYLICNSFWIPMAIFLGAWGMLVSQIVLACINTRGLINVNGELNGDS